MRNSAAAPGTSTAPDGSRRQCMSLDIGMWFYFLVEPHFETWAREISLSKFTFPHLVVNKTLCLSRMIVLGPMYQQILHCPISCLMQESVLNTLFCFLTNPKIMWDLCQMVVEHGDLERMFTWKERKCFYTNAIQYPSFSRETKATLFQPFTMENSSFSLQNPFFHLTKEANFL